MKPGYKQTEVGVIPEEWEVKELANICTFENGDRSSNYPSPGSFRLSGIPFINAGHIADGEISTNEMNYITQEAYDKLGGGKVKVGDILFCLRGSLGKFGLVNNNFGHGAIASSLVIVRPKDTLLNRNYLCYYFASALCALMIDTWAGGAAQPNLGAKELARFLIPLPPLPEQIAIAEVLSDMDALITSTEALISKKRALKQATMQQLLTGQTRLPGFATSTAMKQTEVGVIPEDWEVKRLKSTATLKARIGWQGLTTAEYLDSGKYYLVTGTELISGGIEWKKCHYVDEQRYKQDKNIQLQINDVLVTKDGTIGKIALVSNLPVPATLNSGVFVIRPVKDSFNTSFFYYILASNIFTDFLNQLSAGSTITHLYQKDFISFTFALPPLPEQIAIAEVLSDMDAELDALSAQLAKTRALKQGMMQELLTGRTRLI